MCMHKACPENDLSKSHKKKKNKKQKQIQIRYIEGPLLYCFSRFFFLLYQLKIDIVVWENAKTTKKKK